MSSVSVAAVRTFREAGKFPGAVSSSSVTHLYHLLRRTAPVLPTTLQQRFFSSTNEETVSKRRQFRDIPVQPAVLDYIKRTGVGIPVRRGRKKQREAAVTRSREEARYGSDTWKPPLPFGPDAEHVRVVASVETVDKDDEDWGFPRVGKKNSVVPEVALVGRSNVGKSTLLNVLLYGNRREPSAIRTETRGRRAPVPMKLPKGVKAKTSDKPGETTKITVYQLQSSGSKSEEDESNDSEFCRLRVTDLPGYGFAFHSEEEGTAVQELIMSYFVLQKQRGAVSPLKRVLLLLDARHGLKKSDIDFLSMLQEELAKVDAGKKKKTSLPPIQLVLTKCDLVCQADLARRVIQVREQFLDCMDREPSRLPVMLVSARPRVNASSMNENRAVGGVLELQRELASLASKKIGRKSDRKRALKKPNE